MKEIRNRYIVVMTDGFAHELEAGGLSVGPNGELRVEHVVWSWLQTFVRTERVFAPGTWREWMVVHGREPAA